MIKKFLIICLCIIIAIFYAGCNVEEVKEKEFSGENSSVVSIEESESEDVIVYITDTGTKYHRIGCGSLWNSCNEISLENAKKRGYSPCMKCEPDY